MRGACISSAEAIHAAYGHDRPMLPGAMSPSEARVNPRSRCARQPPSSIAGAGRALGQPWGAGMPDLAVAARVLIATAITVTACASPGQTPRHTGDRGFTVDHPPVGAYRALLDFMYCVRSHGMQMLAPVEWHGYSRLTAYYPLRNASSNAAYRACDYFKALAKQQGGPHWPSRPRPSISGAAAGSLILRRMHMSRYW